MPVAMLDTTVLKVLALAALATLVAAELLDPDLDPEDVLDCEPGAELRVRPLVGRVLRAREDLKVTVRTCEAEEVHWTYTCTASPDAKTLAPRFGRLTNRTPVSLGRDECVLLFSTLQYTAADGRVLKLKVHSESIMEGVKPACQQPDQIVEQLDTVVKLDEQSVPAPREAGAIRTPWHEDCAFEKGFCSDGTYSSYWNASLIRYDVLYEGTGRQVAAYDDMFFVSTTPMDPWAYRLVHNTRVHAHPDEAYATDQPGVTLVVSNGGEHTFENVSQRVPPADYDAEDARRAEATFRLAARVFAEYERHRQQEYNACLRDRLIFQFLQSFKEKQAEIVTHITEANQSLKTLSPKSAK